jgi:DNA-binding beta-propeller fold protein YncE
VISGDTGNSLPPVELPAGKVPGSIAVDGTRNQFYVGVGADESGSDVLLVLDGATNTLRHTLEVGVSFDYLRVNPVNGRLYLVSTYNQIVVLAPPL